MNNGSNIIMKAAAVIMLTTAMACSKVNYTVSEDLPTETFVRYQLDWAGQTDVPSEMTVAMGRIINTVHFSCILDSLGTMTAAYQDNIMAKSDTLTGQLMPNGEYYMISFNDQPKAFTLAGYQDFLENKGSSMRDISIQAIEYNDKEISKLIGSRTDFNPNQKHIRQMNPIWLDVQKVHIHPEIDTIVTIQPRPLTQDITFRICIETDPGVEITKVIGEMSGVPESVQLLSGHISDTLTCRVPFEMKNIGMSGASAVYEGNTCLLGLFPSKDVTFVTGPGILEVSITANVGEQERTFHAGINLQKSITEAVTVEKADENERLYRIARTEAEFDVDARLKIKEGQIVLDGKGQGVEVWFEKENFEFEI